MSIICAAVGTACFAFPAASCPDGADKSGERHDEQLALKAHPAVDPKKQQATASEWAH
jgi:hypothetical protein